MFEDLLGKSEEKEPQLELEKPKKPLKEIDLSHKVVKQQLKNFKYNGPHIPVPEGYDCDDEECDSCSNDCGGSGYMKDTEDSEDEDNDCGSNCATCTSVCDDDDNDNDVWS